jgi:scyllo-inositol 2-dehydrogenase (NADP+)
MAPRPKETLEELPLPQLETDARDYYRNFRDADLYGAELAVKPEEAMRVMKVIDAAFESERTGEAVKLRV